MSVKVLDLRVSMIFEGTDPVAPTDVAEVLTRVIGVVLNDRAQALGLATPFVMAHITTAQEFDDLTFAEAKAKVIELLTTTVH